MAVKTLVLVSPDTLPVPFTTRDTVAVETAAKSATSLIVVDITLCPESGMVGSIAVHRKWNTKDKQPRASDCPVAFPMHRMNDLAAFRRSKGAHEAPLCPAWAEVLRVKR